MNTLHLATAAYFASVAIMAALVIGTTIRAALSKIIAALIGEAS